MKAAILILVLVGNCLVRAEEPEINSAANPASKPKVYSASQAEAHIGSTATVTGLVSEVHFGAKVTSLNFEKAFPNQPFTAVIFAPKTNLFGDLARLKGKAIAVNGKISEFHDRPQIVLNSTNQLKLLEPAASASDKR